MVLFLLKLLKTQEKISSWDEVNEALFNAFKNFKVRNFIFEFKVIKYTFEYDLLFEYIIFVFYKINYFDQIDNVYFNFDHFNNYIKCFTSKFNENLNKIFCFKFYDLNGDLINETNIYNYDFFYILYN